MAENQKNEALEKAPLMVGVSNLMFPLKAGQILVTGISVYEKDGKISFTLSGLKLYEDYMVENGAYGYEVVSEWTNRVDLGYLNAGDIVEPDYGKGFKGLAVLKNCKKVGSYSNKVESAAKDKQS